MQFKKGLGLSLDLGGVLVHVRSLGDDWMEDGTQEECLGMQDIR